jgi:hypothetical protein
MTIFWSAVPLPKRRANSCSAAFTAFKDYEEGIHEWRERDNVVHGTGVRRS